MSFKTCAAVVSANVPRFGGLFPLLALRSGFFLRLRGVNYPTMGWNPTWYLYPNETLISICFFFKKKSIKLTQWYPTSINDMLLLFQSLKQQIFIVVNFWFCVFLVLVLWCLNRHFNWKQWSNGLGLGQTKLAKWTPIIQCWECSMLVCWRGSNPVNEKHRSMVLRPTSKFDNSTWRRYLAQFQPSTRCL